MDLLIKRGTVYIDGEFRKEDILILAGKVAAIGENLSAEGVESIDAEGLWVLPGLVDVHVHFREPGFGYKETIRSGTEAALRGGFTTVCPMPNLKPAPDSPEHLEEELKLIRRDALCNVIPYATITSRRLGHELTDYAAMASEVAGFSDDGSGVQDEEVMRKAMAGIADTGKVLAAHCEVESLLHGGYIHDGEYARTHGHRGICSQSEWGEVERDIRLAAETGCRLHICHVSTRESVELVRSAKKIGLPVTCETGAHYLAFSDDDLQEDGRFKMNPPLRSPSDKEALLRGIADGTIDVIASDHAPHSAEEKSRGLEKSAMGVTGLEVSLAAVYTYAVLTGVISMERMVELMSTNARKIFGFGGGLECGGNAEITIVDFNEKWIVNPSEFASKGKATPFEGLPLYGKVKSVICNGNIYRI